MDTVMPEPISLTSEIERMRKSSGAAHRYAEQCGERADHDRQRMALAMLQLNAVVSMCAELNRQITVLEREVLDIADLLITT